MANFDSRTYCNTFWNMFGTTKNVTKYGPSDPVWEHPWNIFSYLRTWNSDSFGRYVCLTFWNYLKIEKWTLENEMLDNKIHEIRNLKSWKLEIWTFVNWTFESWTIGNFELPFWKFRVPHCFINCCEDGGPENH